MHIYGFNGSWRYVQFILYLFYLAEQQIYETKKLIRSGFGWIEQQKQNMCISLNVNKDKWTIVAVIIDASKRIIEIGSLCVHAWMCIAQYVSVCPSVSVCVGVWLDAIWRYADGFRSLVFIVYELNQNCTSSVVHYLSFRHWNGSNNMHIVDN